MQPDEPAMTELTGVAALKAYLTDLPENTEDTPYRIKVNGINLEKTTTSGDTLRTLYEALIRYVALDLSGCTGEKISNVTVKVAPNKANLVSLILPNTVLTIEVNAFSDCIALSTVKMPKVTTIIHGAFSNLAKLTSVYMPEVQIIENSTSPSGGVFYKCVALTSVSMPKVQSIGNNAFYGCTGLSAITLGSIPPVLEGSNVFKNAQLLSAIYVPAAAVTSYQNTDKTNWILDLKQKIQALP
ncbi:MAG: leucine-rich repeat domain-containing protein [Treponema sp.]|nr:leucine-rich repeat domain-containing protein [Treponema sp.]